MSSVGIYLTEPPYGLAKVRQRAMLNVISAQEAVEHYFLKRLDAHLAGPSALARWQKGAHPLTSRRNAAERPLRADERAVWSEWRRGDESVRARIRAMLEDTGNLTIRR